MSISDGYKIIDMMHIDEAAVQSLMFSAFALEMINLDSLYDTIVRNFTIGLANVSCLMTLSADDDGSGKASPYDGLHPLSLTMHVDDLKDPMKCREMLSSMILCETMDDGGIPFTLARDRVRTMVANAIDDAYYRLGGKEITFRPSVDARSDNADNGGNDVTMSIGTTNDTYNSDVVEWSNIDDDYVVTFDNPFDFGSVTGNDGTMSASEKRSADDVIDGLFSDAFGGGWLTQDNGNGSILESLGVDLDVHTLD
mgnify:CR=1 FL=1